MKVLWLSSALFILLLLGDGKCDILSVPVLDLTHDHGDNTLRLVAKKQHAQVKLPANPSTGYDWYRIQDEAETCSPRVKLISSYFEVPGGQTRMGQGGVLTLTYEAELDGREVIELVYAKSQPTKSEVAQKAKGVVKFVIEVGGDVDKPPCH